MGLRLSVKEALKNNIMVIVYASYTDTLQFVDDKVKTDSIWQAQLRLKIIWKIRKDFLVVLHMMIYHLFPMNFQLAWLSIPASLLDTLEYSL